MGVLKDLGTSVTESVDPITGYPMDSYGHLLDPLSPHSGLPEDNWEKKGTELYNLTNPYGFLHYACGSGDDFWCFDYSTIQSVTGDYAILDATINSETGCFIMGGGYEVLPARSPDEVRDVVLTARGMVDQAVDWMYDNDVQHTKRGWNQDPQFFVNDVCRSLYRHRFDSGWTERMLRMNSKKVQAVVRDVITPLPTKGETKC